MDFVNAFDSTQYIAYECNFVIFFGILYYRYLAS